MAFVPNTSISTRFGSHPSTIINGNLAVSRRPTLPLMRSAPRISADEWMLNHPGYYPHLANLRNPATIKVTVAEREENVAPEVVLGQGWETGYREYAELDDGSKSAPGRMQGMGDVEVKQWQARMRKIDGVPAELKRKVSKRLSSGAASVKSWGAKCARKVSVYWRNDSVLPEREQGQYHELEGSATAPADADTGTEVQEVAEANTAPKSMVESAPAELPGSSPGALMRHCSLKGEPLEPVTTKHTAYSAITTTATFQTAKSGPETRSRSLSPSPEACNPAHLHIILDDHAPPQQIESHAKSLRAGLRYREQKGQLSEEGLDEYFASMYGNRTTEGDQLSASEDWHACADKERAERNHLGRIMVERHQAEIDQATRSTMSWWPPQRFRSGPGYPAASWFDVDDDSDDDHELIEEMTRSTMWSAASAVEEGRIGFGFVYA